MHAPEDPLDLFTAWYAAAQEKEPALPDAMALATADSRGAPSVRMVLLKGFDASGFVFYTNLGSRKAGQIRANPRAALCFHWKSLARQVRVEGELAPVSDEQADAYFAGRDRGSQIGAWASKQSQPLEGRLALEARVARYAARFGIGTVPRPPFWSGFRLGADRIEFWDEGRFRLHERVEYLRGDTGWSHRQLYP